MTCLPPTSCALASSEVQISPRMDPGWRRLARGSPRPTTALFHPYRPFLNEHSPPLTKPQSHFPMSLFHVWFYLRVEWQSVDVVLQRRGSGLPLSTNGMWSGGDGSHAASSLRMFGTSVGNTPPFKLSWVLWRGRWHLACRLSPLGYRPPCFVCVPGLRGWV